MSRNAICRSWPSKPRVVQTRPRSPGLKSFGPQRPSHFGKLVVASLFAKSDGTKGERLLDLGTGCELVLRRAQRHLPGLHSLRSHHFTGAARPRALRSGDEWTAFVGIHIGGRVHIPRSVSPDPDAGQALMEGCRRRGPFDPRAVRGRGIWREGDDIVVSLGDQIPAAARHTYLYFEPPFHCDRCRRLMWNGSAGFWRGSSGGIRRTLACFSAGSRLRRSVASCPGCCTAS